MNRHITTCRQFADLYAELGDVYRAQAWANAAESVTLSGGIGHLSGRLREKLTGPGRVKALAELRTTIAARRRLGKILGVGPATADKWIAAGITTAAMAQTAAASGLLALTRMQSAGLKYRLALARPVPRTVSRCILSKIHRVDPAAMLAGSYRRGAAESGDVDVLTIGDIDAITAQLDVVESFGGAAHRMCITRHGDSVILVDIFATTPSHHAAALLYLTGPSDWTISMRARAAEQGFRLNQHGLFRDGVVIRCDTERAIFEKLGMRYVGPKSRK